jgi:phosphoribosylamine--glycine ligase/phosphoribosylformylglycinamidine cyclo-ligase
VFQWLKEAGNVAPVEMCRTFNSGIGMVIAVDAASAAGVAKALADSGEQVFEIGKLVKREGGEGCVIKNLEAWK